MDGAPTGLETKVPPVVVLALAATLLWLAPMLSGLAPFDFPYRRACAVATAIAGIAIAAAGVVGFRRAGTTVDPRIPDKATSLVTGGIYRLSRNPMYLGMALLLAALALARADAAGLLAVPLFVAYIGRYQIAPEERALAQRFGDEFSGWCRRTRRWL
jgi:protein-S-isoprenylcysteine O-methyltransferase Ste14